jgi:hypothetical protein
MPFALEFFFGNNTAHACSRPTALNLSCSLAAASLWHDAHAARRLPRGGGSRGLATCRGLGPIKIAAHKLCHPSLPSTMLRATEVDPFNPFGNLPCLISVGACGPPQGCVNATTPALVKVRLPPSRRERGRAFGGRMLGGAASSNGAAAMAATLRSHPHTLTAPRARPPSRSRRP